MTTVCPSGLIRQRLQLQCTWQRRAWFVIWHLLLLFPGAATQPQLRCCSIHALSASSMPECRVKFRVLDESRDLKFSYWEIKFSKINIPSRVDSLRVPTWGFRPSSSNYCRDVVPEAALGSRPPRRSFSVCLALAWPHSFCICLGSFSKVLTLFHCRVTIKFVEWFEFTTTVVLSTLLLVLTLPEENWSVWF